MLPVAFVKQAALFKRDSSEWCGTPAEMVASSDNADLAQSPPTQNRHISRLCSQHRIATTSLKEPAWAVPGLRLMA
jgi:hypothetical protein